MNRELFEFLLLITRSRSTASAEGWIPFSNATRPLVMSLRDRYPELFDVESGHVRPTAKAETLIKRLV